MNGKGILKWPDGRKYDGELENDKRHGWGEYIWKDSRRYRGQWKEGKQHGIGFFSAGEGKPERKGEWVEGKRIKWVSTYD
jgi:hypothetical protein